MCVFAYMGMFVYYMCVFLFQAIRCTLQVKILTYVEETEQQKVHLI